MTVERTRLPDRRPSVTQRVEHAMTDGKTLSVLVTFSFDEKGRVREVFSADFKAGSDNQAVIIDSCIMASILMQKEVTPRMLLGSLVEPRSLIGSILQKAAEIDEEKRDA